MSEQNVLVHILESAINAPSGDNAQPWQFKVESDSISIFNVPEGDPTLYNFKQRGSYVGHGALIENICITAAAAGYETTVEPFPGPEGCTARIDLKKGTLVESPLASAIALRSTHRKPYADVVLKDEDRAALHAAVSDPLVRLAITDKRSVRALGDLAATNERILFEHQPLHHFLFNMIRWSKEEEKAKPGLYIETMEFPKPLQVLMRHVFRHWRIVRALNSIGLSKFVSKQSGLNHGSCSAFGAIIITGYADTDFSRRRTRVRAGMAHRGLPRSQHPARNGVAVSHAAYTGERGGYVHR